MNFWFLAIVLTALDFPPAAPGPISEAILSRPLPVESRGLEYVDIRFEFDSTPTNNLEIALGCDQNQNGQLDLVEADVRLGYDCGQWFDWRIGDGTWAVSDTTNVGQRVEHVWRIEQKGFNPDWNMMRLIRRGTDETNEQAELVRKKVVSCVIVR